MKEKDFTIISTQLAVFFEKILDKPDDLHLKLNEKLGNIFDQAPIIVPIPKGNAELYMIPVVQMNSSANYNSNIAYGRADFIKLGKGIESFNEVGDDFTAKSKFFVDFFLENNIKINRIGFVTKYFVRADSPDEKISNLLNSNFKNLQGGTSIETHIINATRIIEENGEEINSLLSFNRMSKNIFGVGGNLNGFEIMFDINTAPEKAEYYVKEINSEFIHKFINNNIKRNNIKDIISLMYGN